jgi:hypothetical protein
MQAPFGRMKMCHMIADTTEELLAMADTIGVDHRWLQHRGNLSEHFDICMSMKTKALKAGAKLVTQRELSDRIRAKKSPEGPFYYEAKVG